MNYLINTGSTTVKSLILRLCLN